MRMARVLAPASLLMLALPAGAAEVEFGWEASTAWDSNVTHSATNEEDAFSIYTGPTVRIGEPRGDLRYELEYRGRYEAFLDLDDANAFEHFARAVGTWDIDHLTQVQLFDQFSSSKSLRDFLDPTAPDALAGQVLIDRERILSNVATASASRWLSKRNQLTFDFAQEYYDFEREERSDALSFRGSASLRRSLSERQSAGIGFAVTRLVNQETSFQEEFGTTYLESFAFYEILLSRALRLSLSGGPTWVLPDEFSDERPQLQYAVTTTDVVINGARFRFPVLARRAGCQEDLSSSCRIPAPVTDLTTGTAPVLPPPLRVPVVDVEFDEGAPESDSNLTFFGTAALNYVRPPYLWSLRYTRRASNASGTGTSTNLDIATAFFAWEPSRRWRFTARASWQRRTASSEIPIVRGVVNAAGVDLLLDENGAPVTDLADARYRVQDVAEIGAIRTVDFDDDALDLDSYQVALRASHRLTRRIVLDAVTSYWFQTSGRETTVENDRDGLRFEIGVTWYLEPLRL